VSQAAAFLDTVGLLALWNRSDQWHVDADRAFRGILADGVPLISTRPVLLECGNAAARKPYRLEAERLRTELEAGGYLVEISQEDWEGAWACYRRCEADGAGIVDHLSFQVMRRLGLNRAFTNDRHYRAAGFVTLF
jgi:predicted nucleic acid-binding protein